MNQKAAEEYFKLCDLHNRAFEAGDHQAADKYWQQTCGFILAYESAGSDVGELVMAADNYVSAKYAKEVETNCGRLLWNPNR